MIGNGSGMVRRSMVIACGLWVGIGLIYVAVCLGLRQWQTRLLFFPNSQLKMLPEAAGLTYQDIWLSVGVGDHQGTVHGWWIPAPTNADGAVESEPQVPTVLYLHGNGSNVGDLLEMGQQFHDLGWNCLLMDYRGYGLSQGSFPAEDRVYEDAEAGWHYLVQSQNIKPENIVVYGHSLGGAIAIELAIRQPEMAGLIVEGSFTSMLEMAALQPRYRLFPLNWIVTQRFDSLAKVRSLRPPLLLVHGTEDETIPYRMSQQLQEAAKQSIHQPQTEVVLIPNAGHNDIPEVGGDVYIQAIRTFVERLPRSHPSPMGL